MSRPPKIVGRIGPVLLVDGLPAFPAAAVGCTRNCGFQVAGIGLQCKEGDACGRYVHPGDPGFDELKRYHNAINAPDTEPLETVSLKFNYEPGVLRRAGFDVETSEGRSKVKDLLLAALEYYAECSDDANMPAEDRAIIEALLSEGP